MNRIFSYFLILAAISITAAGGMFHGQLSHRWGPRNDVSLATKRLENFPQSVGHWQSHESYQLGKSVTDLLQCNAYLNRRYVHDETGETINVALLLGPSGPISVHTPEVCYSSREFKQLAKRTTVTIFDGAKESSDFWALTFESNGLEKTLLRVYYAWTVDGHWAADASPRFKYAGKPFLFKIQLAAILPPESDTAKNDPCRNFLQDFVPALNQHLFVAEMSETK